MLLIKHNYWKYKKLLKVFNNNVHVFSFEDTLNKLNRELYWKY